MKRAERLEPSFVDEIPPQLQPETLYVSMQYGTALHLCACGCGNEVVTPLHPTRWRLSYDGESVSLHPSVGSGSLPCRSHYFIRSNNVVWMPYSEEEAAIARARDRDDVAAYFDVEPAQAPPGERSSPRKLSRLWSWIRRDC